MIGGFFAVLASYAFVLGKAVKANWDRTKWEVCLAEGKYDYGRQLELDHYLYSDDPAKQRWVEERLGYKVGKSCPHDHLAACKKLMALEGLRYLDVNHDWMLDPVFCRECGKPIPTEADQKKAKEYEEFLARGAMWRKEHPRGKDFPISPYIYKTKQDYFNVIDIFVRAEEAKRHLEDMEKNNKSVEWRKWAILSLKEHGYFYLHNKLNPNDYKTEEEFLDAAKKIDDEYRKYKVFLKGGGIKFMEYFDIDQFNEKWDKTRATCESDEACAISIYQMITRNDLSRSIYKEYFDILEDKCNMLGLSFSDITQASSG